MTDALSTYTHGHQEAVVSQHRKRTAAEAAAFLLPHLTPAMRILDVGCGPGSITVGLADAVPAGEVIGLDLAEAVLPEARALATERGTRNVTFTHGDLYWLPFPDGAFDVVYAHQVLQHLAQPVVALREMRRRLKPGGMVAVRDSDYGTCTWSPADPHLTRWLALYHAVARRNGAEADAGRFLRGWLLDAGFETVQTSGTTWTFPGYEPVETWATSWAERTVGSNLARQAVEYGFADRAELEAIAGGFRAWARHPAAFFSIGHVEALGHAPGRSSTG